MIKEYIESVNRRGDKVLSVFLTAGFPVKEDFVSLALKVLDAGADMLEIGIPFSDPLADGPVIQQSSQSAINNGVTTADVLRFAAGIRAKTDKPLILMGYGNPVLNYGREKFFNDAATAGVNGLIIPDVPLEEYNDFFTGKPDDLEAIMLTTPQSGDARIREIDSVSKGFVYCVSVSGTTGARSGFSESELSSLEHTRQKIVGNKMLVGFGISGPETAKQVLPYCDGIIVGSAVIKRLLDGDIDGAVGLVAMLQEVLV
ncbi:MAG: tryptophan synthase alpha chain [Ignavibacteriaceae bacterium]|nr:MAG: tryptophan synthase subunit alpha [Chlorobiota bacterium]GJQ33113.1 MAG: tryptophan synthase alpha chain [Ignavibacteriaceae bacterium]